MKIQDNISKFIIENDIKLDNKDKLNDFKILNEKSLNIEKEIVQTIKNINNFQVQAEDSIKNYFLGKENLHNVLFNLEKAKFAINLSVRIRDKIIEAYQNIMRMQL